MTNLLIAISNLIANPRTNLTTTNTGANRANSMGDALETYIKDLFCNSFNEAPVDKNRLYSENFSYTGTQNSPPDIIIRDGDAIEVKKIENLRSGIALNSSYPKDKIYSNSTLINQACRDCEHWCEKDLIYTIGVVKNQTLKTLWFIYGNCYSANKETYERVKNAISSGVNELPNVVFATTNELARVNRVDPLGITYLRIRGMWGIENPIKVFDYAVSIEPTSIFVVNAILLRDKYLSFPEQDRIALENLVNDNFTISDIRIKSPNNPANLLDAKLLSLEI